MNCRYCGTTLPDGAAFCGECGRAVTAAAPTPPSGRKRPEMPAVVPSTAAAPLAFSAEPDAEPPARPTVHIPETGFNCPQCGEPISPADVFCGECGFVLTGSKVLEGAVDSRDTAVVEVEPLVSDDGVPESSAGFLELSRQILEISRERVVEGPSLAEESTSKVQDAAVAEADEVASLLGASPIAEEPESQDSSRTPDAPSPEAEDEDEAEAEAEAEAEEEDSVLADSDAPVMDPVVSFFASPRKEESPAAQESGEREQSVEPIPLVELVASPFREPVVTAEVGVVPEPEPEPAPAPAKALRKVPDPFPWGTGAGGLAVDLEATRAVVGTRTETRFVLQFSTGESVTVTGAGLVGRNPSSQPGEYVDQLVTIFDAGKSVSKTHLEFGQDAGRFWVSDRYSTNGTTVRQPDMEPKRCDPGRRYYIARGTRVDIGEQFFVVS